MRILLSADTIGGVWDYATTLANAAAADGHSVLIAAFGEPDGGQLDGLAQSIDIDSRAIPLEWLPAAKPKMVAGANWLAGLSRTWDADVAHLNQMTPSGLVRFEQPTLVVVHSDVCSWFGEVLGAPAPAEWAEYVEAVRAGLALATTVVAPSTYQARLARRHFGRDTDRVIYNALDCPPSPDDRTTHRKEPLVLAAGRAWDRAKGFQVLDDAVGLLGSAAPPAHVLGPLEGPNGQGFSARYVVTHGRVPLAEVRRRLATATIYVAPSLYEPFGLAPLEAALHGCALLLSDIGSFEELWGGCAEFFPSGSARGLASAIESLMGDPAWTGALAGAARQRALAAYSVERFAEQYLALYRRMAPTKRRTMAIAPLEDRCT